MQLKGLIRFFTILLIVYSLYQLSFTWFVKNHEKKMEARAKKDINDLYPAASVKYPNNSVAQSLYQDTIDKAYEARLRQLLDSTKDVTLTYGINGAVSYQKAKEEELNLGLDLQGGMNVTLEVEMTGLLRSLSNNTKDPNFQQALVNADKRKANSGSNFITLFVEEYRKLENARPLASLFAGASNGKIDVNSSDASVRSYLETQAQDAFSRTYQIISTRIDQFGVAQPNVTANTEKQIINVELPGIKDKERVRKILQSTANLQFWEVYTYADQSLVAGLQKTVDQFNAKYGGATTDSTITKDPVAAPDSTIKPEGTGSIDEQLGTDTGNDSTAAPATGATTNLTIDRFLKNPPNQAAIGAVAITDTAEFRKYLTEFRYNFPPDAVFAYGIPEKDKRGRSSSDVPLYALRTYGRATAELEGDAISDARQDFDQYGNPEIVMEMKSFGAAIWKRMTAKAAGVPNDPNDNKPIAIVLDNIVYSAPNVLNEIPNGISSITGRYNQQEALDLANILKAGKLPAPAKIVQDQQVGPTLGSEAIRGGTMAFAISFIVIFLLMLIYYNTGGWVANIALILNLLFTIGVLAGLGATLTAPGIAGLVLTIGMAVDTNVIIFERIKEELTRGKSYAQAIKDAYHRSLPPVLDGHITTLLTAIILFYFGLGPVKGFATTQILGLLLSLFCGILVSRWITDIFISRKRHLKYFTSVSRRIFQHAKFKFIEYRKVAYAISFVVLALGIGAFINGFDYGVEFNGGRSYTVRFDQPVNVEQVREELKQALEGDNPIIKTIGDNQTLDITTAYKIEETGAHVDSVVQQTLLTGLKNHLPAGITYEKFDQTYKLGSKKVLPTISDDLKAGAVNATIFALIVIFLYIFIRFRDWRYSVGTIVALLHDVLVTLIVFSFAKNIVPFPLEIDQHFIAAILTVIGFSMNDTVIIFDRIREDSRLMPGAPKTEIINRAINETLSRTVMTSVTVFLTLLILFIVGGEVTRGFAFAMLVGVITGIYSSVFVAAPILVDLGGGKEKKKKDTAGIKKGSPAVNS